ncbi:hypothetical protein E2562_031882 [Oryza meyeriana var. granulata]|uniref:Uncharacterized protein n=1 Tax=Oryza meyeriana var. granulata TaxID=110450 RepID=A0A6G1F070_9ORYZ|nr:hypothetical protein E2562_031882 [Oryza meyeriana var. granulata]
MKGGGGSSSISPLVSFVLGAAMATICILFVMSASPGHRLADISAWSSAEDTPLPQSLHEVIADANDSLLAVAAAPNVTVVAGPAPALVQETSVLVPVDDPTLLFANAA